VTLIPVFEPLQAHHDRQAFDCGKSALNEFLQRQARQNADRSVGVTHVALPDAGSAKILAYYTLITRTVDASIVPARKLPRGDIGVVLLGRLAVDRSAQGQGLGKLCLLRAMRQVEQAPARGPYALPRVSEAAPPVRAILDSGLASSDPLARSDDASAGGETHDKDHYCDDQQ